MDKELERRIEKGNKRLALVCSVWTSIFAIPLLIITAITENQHIQTISVFIWLIIVIIGMALSPKIANKIWKD